VNIVVDEARISALFECWASRGVWVLYSHVVPEVDAGCSQRSAVHRPRGYSVSLRGPGQGRGTRLQL